jgi:L-iditol 2-dehydrogenase
MTMLELYLKEPEELVMRQVESCSSLKPDEVKIRLIYGGICGSDLHAFKGKFKHASYPVRAGHEVLGTIIESGADAEYPVGTRVVLLPNTFCGECDWCRKGKTNLCRHKQSLGINADGGFAEELVISSRYVMPVPDDLSDEKAVLTEPFAVVVHAFKKVRIQEGTSVAIVGCGTEGLLSAALALYLGADVTAIDINPSKLQLVRSLGELRAVLPHEVQGETFDVVIEAAGTRDAFEQGLQLVTPGGEMVLIGMAQEATIPVSQFVRSELTLYGSIIYRFPDDFAQSIEYLRDPRLRVDRIVSRILPFTQFREAYEWALTGQYGKILLDFKGARHP